MKENRVLINFQIPIPMKERFDAISEMTGKSKASILNSLVENYILDQLRIEEQKVNTLQDIDSQIQKHNFVKFRDFIENP